MTIATVGFLVGLIGLFAFAQILVRKPLRWPARVVVLTACLAVPAALLLSSSVGGGNLWQRMFLVGTGGMLVGGLMVAVVAAFRAPPRDPSTEWAHGHGVEPSRRNADLIVAYVREGHRLRLVCGIGGYLVAKSAMSATGVDPHVNSLVWLLVGYLIGCLWSEAWLTRLPDGAQRAASLTTRSLSDYLAGRLRVAQVVMPVVAVVVAPIVWRAKVTRTGVGGRVLPWADPATLHTAALFLGVGGPFTMGVIWVLQRHIVRKPQPLLDDELLAVDDAIRSSSVHLLSGTGIAIVFLLLANGLLDVGRTSADGTTDWATLAGISAFLLGIVSWRYYGHRGWRVRRPWGSAGTGRVASPPAPRRPTDGLAAPDAGDDPTPAGDRSAEREGASR